MTLELICSHLSGKKKVFRDGKLIFDVQKFGTSFQYPFQINNHMLNIIQHGEIFELRIDNQSFQHMYHQERTKNAFVYEGDADQKESEDRFGSQNYDKNLDTGKNENQSNDNNFGYGGYKKGHDVNTNWVNENANKNADNVRKRSFDSYSPSNQKSIVGNNNVHKSGTFFDNYGSNVVIKKAEYINKTQNVDNLLDMGENKNKQVQNVNNQKNNQQSSNFFDFDFNSTSQQQKSDANGFDFNFAPSNKNQHQQDNQPKSFDFDAFSGQKQVTQQQSLKVQNNELIFDLIEQQPQKTLDDLFSDNVNMTNGFNNQNQNMNNSNPLQFEEQRKIQELLATGYSQVQQQNPVTQQFIPNPMVNQGSNFNIQQQPLYQNNQINNTHFGQQNFQNLGNENLEQKLVNLDSLGQGANKNSSFKQNNDPFSDAFSTNVKSTIPQNQKDAFSFVQTHISSDSLITQQTQQIQGNSQIGSNFMNIHGQQQTQINQNTGFDIGINNNVQNQNQNQDFFFGFQQNNQQKQNQNNNSDFNFF